MKSKPAVAVVFHHISSYYQARFNAAADSRSVTGFESSAKAYEARGAADLPVRCHKIFLFPKAADRYPGIGKRQRPFCSALAEANRDVVAVHGWNNFGSLAAALTKGSLVRRHVSS